ncbi:MAG: Maf family protein [Phycisphaerae bacterium]
MSDRGKKLILASSSPRRRELLSEAGYQFQTDEPRLEEPTAPLRRLSPRQAAEALAYFKARSIADGHDGEAMILGADTIVAGPGEMGVVGKPADVADARRILQGLSGSRHAVITGVALVDAKGARRIASDVTWVTMKQLTEQELEEYIASGQWEGKAGAYGIQGRADRFVTRLEGSYSNVVGLPMELLGRLLGQPDRPGQQDET